MSGAAEQTLSLRNDRKACHFWVDNEVADCYQAIIGADATWVYCRIARNAHGAWIVSPKSRGGDPRVSLREMAEWCGKSVDTVWRCLQVLEHVGLIQTQTAAKAKGRYALADVKDLVLREGGAYDRATGSTQLPAARAAALKAEVKVLRAKLARKASGLAVIPSVNSVAQSDSLGGGLFSAPEGKCDSSVAQSDTSVAPGAQPSITTRLQESKTEIPPQPPSAAADGGVPAKGAPLAMEETPASGGEEAAFVEFCDRHGFEARRLRLKLRAVWVRRRRVTGTSPVAVIAEMDVAWERVGRAGPRLFRQPKAREFFEDGLWLDANRWPWDNEEIREAGRRAGARAGMHFG